MAKKFGFKVSECMYVVNSDNNYEYFSDDINSSAQVPLNIVTHYTNLPKICKSHKINTLFLSVMPNEKYDKLFSTINNLCGNLTDFNLGIVINNLEHLTFFEGCECFNSIKDIFINPDIVDNEKIHTMYFLGKRIYLDCFTSNLKAHEYQKYVANPMIFCVYTSKQIHDAHIDNLYFKPQVQHQIANEVCHININNVLKHTINKQFTKTTLLELMTKVWGYYLIYNISDVPELTDEQITEVYHEICNELGMVKLCRPVNSLETSPEISRDVKFVPGTNHYYSSNNKQPFHTDHAYYEAINAPDWILLCCLQQSEFGGVTSVTTTKLLCDILEKYDPGLGAEMKTKVPFIYKESDERSIIHLKQILDSNKSINWNYYQIFPNGDNKISELRDKILNFFEKYIFDGNIFTISKKWKRGECVIINDHYNLHCRSSFFGDRWLKSYHFFDKDIKQ